MPVKGGVRKQRLKVFRTAIGFHDAYVAAPSQKAALAAWGASANLFAIGSAEQVTDPELTAAPLASPGTVVKRARGSLTEHLDAADRAEARRPGRQGRGPSRPRGPKPSRDKLSEAEDALDRFRAEARADLAEFDRRAEELRKARNAAEDRQRKTEARLEKQVERARERYEQAMARWH